MGRILDLIAPVGPEREVQKVKVHGRFPILRDDRATQADISDDIKLGFDLMDHGKSWPKINIERGWTQGSAETGFEGVSVYPVLLQDDCSVSSVRNTGYVPLVSVIAVRDPGLEILANKGSADSQTSSVELRAIVQVQKALADHESHGGLGVVIVREHGVCREQADENHQCYCELLLHDSYLLARWRWGLVKVVLVDLAAHCRLKQIMNINRLLGLFYADFLLRSLYGLSVHSPLKQVVDVDSFFDCQQNWSAPSGKFS